jgi:stress-induced morphogen
MIDYILSSTKQTEKSLSLHILNSNKIESKDHRRIQQCSHCIKSFDRPSLLIRHIRTHTGEKPYICDVCSKAFSTSSSLNTHRRIHSGEKPHRCEICQKCFTASSNLYYHRMTHNKVCIQFYFYFKKLIIFLYRINHINVLNVQKVFQHLEIYVLICISIMVHGHFVVYIVIMVFQNKQIIKGI